MNDYYKKERACAFHPGGFELTRYAVEKCAFRSGAKLCDIGCGRGDTVEKLNGLGYNVVGTEPSAAMRGKKEALISSYAEDTGFPPESFDGVLLECVLSLTDDAEKSLAEAFRILKCGGKLILSDLYAERGAVINDGPVGRVFAEDEIRKIVGECGFRIELFEDHSREMAGMAAQMIMDGEDICCAFGKIKAIRGRYFLLIAEKVPD